MKLEIGQIFRGNSGVVYVINDFFNMDQQVAHSDYLTGEKWGSPKSLFEDSSLFCHLPACTKLHRKNPFSKITDDIYPVFNVYHAEEYIAGLKEYYPNTPFAESSDHNLMKLLASFSEMPVGFEKQKENNFPVFIKSTIETVFDEPDNANDAGKTFLSVGIYGSLKYMERLVENTKRQALLDPTHMAQINGFFN